jgi:hypothetical protein
VIVVSCCFVFFRRSFSAGGTLIGPAQPSAGRSSPRDKIRGKMREAREEVDETNQITAAGKQKKHP